VEIDGTRHKAMADQVTTVTKGRLQNRLGRLTAQEMEAVDRAIRVQLGL
jgi:mRNA interferase MazF